MTLHVRLRRNCFLTILTIVLLLGVPTHAAAGAAAYLNKPDAWFASEEGKRVASNVLSHQSDLGGWPKNTDTTNPFAGDRKGIKPTFDNGATIDELWFLAKAYAATQEATYRTAFERGLDYILKAQYASGGWPQFFPPPEKTYHRHITFNDNAMVRVMMFLREVADDDRYMLAGSERRKAAREAFDRGVECILKCQVKVEGKLTAWCAQHDEKDFTPRTGRSYELPSLSGSESVGVTRLLMSLDQPSPAVIRAIDGAVSWFEKAKLAGMKIVVRDDSKAPKGKDRVVVADPKATPLWARFHEIGSDKPIFADRDGVKKYSLAEIGYERRNGYAWYGTWPQRLLEVEYPAWKKRVGATAEPAPPPTIARTAADVPYGAHPRQVLDFWRAESDRPTPVVVLIHGGGWVNGDKSGYRGAVKRYLDAGISVVAINYRFVTEADQKGISPPVKWPLEDAARAIQFIRSKEKDWNIAKDRVGATGGSAGGCSSLWLAFHNDLADPKSPDPVARESTRLSCVAVTGAQTTLDPKLLREWMPNARYGGHAFGVRTPQNRDGAFQKFFEQREKLLPWIEEYSPLNHVSADDPAVFLEYPAQKKPPVKVEPQDDPTHSALLGMILAEKLNALNVECILVYPGKLHEKYKTSADFLIDRLRPKLRD